MPLRDDGALAVNNHRCWDGSYAKGTGDLHLRIEERREGIAVSCEERADRFYATATEGNREHDRRSLLQGIVCPLHGGHFSEGGESPG